MSYESGDSLLADARLRLDMVGDHAVVLIVEGPDDKRLFAEKCAPSAIIVPAGGRRLLLSAHEKLRPDDDGRILFITDCDYEVRAGVLRGAKDLIITEAADLEMDLLSLPGVPERLVRELVPEVHWGADTVAKILGRATEFAQPLGRARCAAQPLGESIDEFVLRHKKCLLPDGRVNDTKIYDNVQQYLARRGVERTAWINALDAVPNDRRLMKGKDLLDALEFLGREYKGVRGVSEPALRSMLRLAAHAAPFEEWVVIRRARVWEESSGRRVFA